MNLPNKLTILRMILIPFFVVFMLAGTTAGGEITGGYDKWVALVIFVVASLTDTLDGMIARKYNLITDFGKLMDPLADKLLVCSALVCLVELKRCPAWIVILIIAREFIISGIRQVAADKGRVIAASYYGKFKTVFQMIMIILMIIDLPQLKTITIIAMYAALVLTVVSMGDYIGKNKDVFTGSM